MSKAKKSVKELLQEALVPREEQPYEVPGNWVWVRLESVVNVTMGQSPNGKNTTTKPTKYPLIGGPADMGEVVPNVSRYTKIPTKLSNYGDLIISVRATLGKINFSDNAYCIGRGVASLTTVNTESRLLHFYFENINKQLPLISKGSTFLQLNKASINNLKYPLPPPNEQKRIADKIDRLFVKLDRVQTLLNKVQDAHHIRHLAILDKAVKGTLVQQNFCEESSEQLLSNIADLKRLLVKQKKMKDQKKLPALYPNEIPYEIPEHWKWVRLGEVIELISGRDVNAKECNSEAIGVPYIMGASNLKDDKITVERWIKQPSVVGRKDDILLSVKGTVGKIVIQELDYTHLSRQIMGIRTIENSIYNRYVKMFIQTYVQILKSNAKGVIPGIAREDILLAPFPLPPYEEQVRIVRMASKLLCNTNKEEKITDEINERIPLLKKSILNKAFRGELGTNDPTEDSALELLKETLQQKST